MRINTNINHLVKRQDTYYWRYRTPKDLSKLINKREFVLSLRTSSLQQACELVRSLDKHIKYVIRNINMNNNSETIRMLSRSYFIEILELYQNKDLSQYLFKDDLGRQHNELEYKLSDTHWEELYGVYAHLDAKIRALLPSLPKELQRRDDDSLERSLNRGYKQAYKVLSARAEGDYSDTVNDSMFQDLPVAGILDGQVSRGIKLTELHELYEAERNVSKDTLTKHRSCLGLFIELFGDVDVSFITKAIYYL